tara:strand:- start:38 stop:1741 length:1704 start_codon:yes stop_codon:yes gene_type:complete
VPLLRLLIAAAGFSLCFSSLGCGTVNPSAKTVAASSTTAGLRGSLVVINAQVFGHPDANAVLIAGDRILDVGATSTLRHEALEVIDAEGAWVAPGFVDPHVHLLKGGLSMTRVQLKGLTTPKEVGSEVERWAEANPKEPWVLGRGWSYDITPVGTYPTRATLDAAVPDRPVSLDAYDGHSVWCNSLALKLAGIDASTPDPPGGIIVREADGKTPQGTLLESARNLVRTHVPQPSRDQKLDALYTALKHARQLGITTVGDVSYESDRGELLAELLASGRLPIRVVVGLPLDDNLAAAVKNAPAWQSERLRLGFAKGFVDGVIESRTALMVAPYPDSNDRGHPLQERDVLEANVQAAYDLGVPVALHAIGDGAVRMSLNVLEAVTKGRPMLSAPARIEHIEVLHPSDVARFSKLSVVASMQPYHALPSDADTPSGPWSTNVGRARWPMTFPWRTLVDAGALVAFGSDWPVMSIDPLYGIAVATTRRNSRGLPESGRQPDQVLTANEAVNAYTESSAKSLGLDEVGVLRPGAFADLIILRKGVSFDHANTLWKTPGVKTVIVNGVSVSHK